MRSAYALAFTVVLAISSPARAQVDGGAAPAVDPAAAARTPEARDRDEGAATSEGTLSPAQLQARIHYDQSRAHYAAGHYRDAVRSLEAAVVIDPEGANLWYNLGNVSERLGDLERASVAYRRYLDRTRDPVELERTRRILTRLDGAREEFAAMQRRMGRADGAFWAVTGAAIAATGFGAAWLLSSRGDDSTVAPWAITSGGFSLGVLAAVLYLAREAPREPTLRVSISPAGGLDLGARF